VASSDTDVWIGGDDYANDGTFVWTNGEPFTYPNGDPPWASGEPNDGGFLGSSEECLEMRVVGNLNDEGCDSSQHFLCERAPAGTPK
jgi:hypothetical protein